MGGVGVAGVAKLGRLSMPGREPRDGETVSQIMRPQRLATVETGKIAGCAERQMEARLGAGNAASRWRAYWRSAVSVVA
jgi:hypothetical protein